MVAGCERGDRQRSEALTSPQLTLTTNQEENLRDAAANFAGAFEDGVESGDLDPDRELIVVMKDAGVRPAAAGPRMGPGSVQVFRADAGFTDTRTDLGFASANTDSRAAVRELLSTYGLEPEWEGRALPVLSVVIPESTDLEALSEELLQSPHVDYRDLIDDQEPIDDFRLGPAEFLVRGQRITVHGNATTPCRHSVPTAELVEDSGRLILSIGSTDRETCATVPSMFKYTARIGPVEAGKQRLEVRQHDPGHSAMRTVADTTLDVGT